MGGPGTGTFVRALLVFPLLLTVAQAATCDADCQSQQRSSLVELYAATGGQGWRRQSGWNSGSLDHCSWFGVSCCGPNDTPNASKPRSGACNLPRGVAGLDLGLNNLTGAWPAAALAGLSSSLAYINLRGNNLQGRLPESISGLRQLSVLYIDDAGLSGALPASLGQLANLTQLSAAGNGFSGALPGSLAQLQRLRRLSVSSNALTGVFPASLLALPQLQQLDVSNNKLSGQLPLEAPPGVSSSSSSLPGPLAVPSNEILEVRLSRNQIGGPLPAWLASMSVILLDVSYNKLGGSLPAAALGSNLVLQELLLAGNQFSGSLSADMLSGNLRVLDLSSNALSGSLPSLAAGSLQQLDLSNNSLTGQLPADVAELPALRQLRLTGNELARLQGLPAFLALDSSAPAVAVDPVGQPGLLCQPVVLAGSSSSSSGGATVQLDPATYSYQGCYCKAPLTAVTQQQDGWTVSMACGAKQGAPLAAVLGPLLSVTAVALIALACVAAAWRCGLAGLVQRITVEAEKKTPPGTVAKDITLVLTDVQGSTELWEWDQQLASDAFKTHDRVLRQYMTQFYGYEVSTEGDAFLVAFHEPFDAVAWCLCVQLALHYADWPEPLLMHKSTCLDTADTLELKRRQRQDRWQTRMTRAAASDREPGGTAAAGGWQAGAAAGAADAAAGGVGAAGGLRAAGVAGNETDGPLEHFPDTLPPAPLVAVDQDPAAAFYEEGMLETGQGSSSENALEAKMAVEGTAQGGPGGKAEKGVLFRGLRVRMSIATGGVDSIRMHSVTQRAEYVGEVLRKVQAVGETPHGGQIMMDSDTFRGIHARLPELGGAVLEATQKLLRNNSIAGPSAQEIAEMFSMPMHPEHPERLKRSVFLGRSSPTNIAPASQSGNVQHSTLTFRPEAASRASQADIAAAAGAASEAASASFIAATQKQQIGRWSCAEQGFSGTGDIEQGPVNCSPRPPRAQRGLLHHAAHLLGLRDDDSVRSSMEGMNGAAGTFAEHSSNRSPPASPRSALAGTSAGCTTGTGLFSGVLAVAASNAAKGVKSVHGWAVNAAATAPGGLLAKGTGGRGRRRSEEWGGARRRSSLSYGVMVIDMGVHQLSGLPQKVNLIQVMPCGLEDRARFFPRLDSLRQETPGYFDAPAAGLVPLGPGSGGATLSMPAVTIVFCTIDKYCEIVEVNREAAELALELYSDCVRWLLLVGGGYECQEAEGTFMVAFSSADVAIEWCLMVQQVLRDMSWPASVLELPTCEEERDMHGNVMFRGPRVKMGIYCGTPTRVIPHTTTGRADYFGPVVNRAARYCHAAARGGQVLVPKELMCEVISKWVLIDPTELVQSDRLLELVAYFDEVRRVWPWMFKRRAHWEVPVPPHLYSQPSQQGQSQQGAASQQQGIYAGSNAGGQSGYWMQGEQLQQQQQGMDGIDPGDALQQQQQRQRQQQYGGAAAAAADGFESFAAAAAAAAGAEHPGSSESSSHNPSCLSDLVPARLAPLHEAAECGGSSRCPSEHSLVSLLQPEHSRERVASTAQHTTQGPEPIIPTAPRPPVPLRQSMRRHSDLAQSYSRMGPQAAQAVQSMVPFYAQGGGSTPAQNLFGGPPAPPPPPAVAAALLAAQQAGGGRYRRPSYLSDVSAPWYRRYSNMSDSSSVQINSGGATVASGGTSAGGGGGWRLSGAAGQSSRRPSAMSDFFPLAQHSRRPSSNMSGDVTMGLGWAPGAGPGVPALVPGVGLGAVEGAVLAPRPPLAVLLQQQQQQQQMMAGLRQPGSPRGAQLYQQHQQNRAAGPAAGYLGSSAAAAAAYGQGRCGPVTPGYGSLQGAQLQQQWAAAAAGSSQRKGSWSQPSNAPHYTAAQQQQLQADWAAAGYSRRADASTAGSSAAAEAAAATAGSGHSSGPLSNPVASSSTGGSRGSNRPRPLPAAVMLQGLESQVMPGMLHSSNRLRLVSKRRRQMSYCFFQESSKPVIPADGANPKHLLPANYSASTSGSYPLAAMGAGLATVPSQYAGSEPANSTCGREGLGPGGLVTMGSIASSLAAGTPNTGGSQSAGGGGFAGVGAGGVAAAAAAHALQRSHSVGSSGGGGGGFSRRGSARTSAAESSDTGGAAAAAAAARMVDPLAAAAATAQSSGELPGVEDMTSAAAAAASAASAAAMADGDSATAAGLDGSNGLSNWPNGNRAAAMASYCGLPEIKPLPDAEVIESLRMSVPQRLHRPSNMSTMTGVAESVAGFEGPGISSMCADIMRGRWLWIGELLVHDLGKFRFKGVAGVHSIVSVTSEELGGRTFPTTIRRGKGEQVRLGRGLLALVQMLPSARGSSWLGTFQGQQLLQSPGPPMQQQQQYVGPGGVCQTCNSSLGLGRRRSGIPALDLDLQQLQLQAGGQGWLGSGSHAAAAAAGTPHSVGGYYGIDGLGTLAAAAGFGGGGVQVPGFMRGLGRMRRPSSLGDLMLAKAVALGKAPSAAAGMAGHIGMQLQHHSSAPEPAAAEALAAAAGGADAMHYGMHSSTAPEHSAQQHLWQMQSHLWQLQLIQQQQQQQRRRRRHSICMGSMQHRCWSRPYGVMGEMMPFQETNEWPQQCSSAPSGCIPQRPSNQQQQQGLQQQQQQGLVGRDVMLGHILPPSPIAEDPADTAGGLSSGSLCGLQGSTARSTAQHSSATLPSAAFSSALGSPTDPGTTPGGVSRSHAAFSGSTADMGLSSLPGGSSFFSDGRGEEAEGGYDDVAQSSDVASASSEQQQLQQGTLGDEAPVRSSKVAQGRSAAASLRSSSE